MSLSPLTVRRGTSRDLSTRSAVRGREQSLLDRLRKLDGVETRGGEGVVFAALVNHSDVAVRRGLFVGNHPVKLTDFERGFVALVVEAHDEARPVVTLLPHRSSRKGSFSLNSLLPRPCASYQCTSASRIVPSRSRRLATPFSLRQRPLPYCLRSLARSRTPRPPAMVSTST